MRALPFSLAVGTAGMLATACSDPTTVQPRPRAPASWSPSLTIGIPALYPNSWKYSTNGAQPAVGRSGTASVSMRALLGASGTTDVEVTTGSFEDGSSASGSFSMVQVKSEANGVAFTSNNTGLTSASATFAYAGLSHGATVNVRAVVRGIDGRRSDVVTVDDQVRFRPDLVVYDLEGPAAAPLGGAVNFYATLGEQMGDLGARASCVLYVDGAPTDRADNIWVDAHGVVSCLLTHVFATKGTHALAVRIENVQPGDYDNSNNGATSSINIVDPNGFTAYSLQAYSLSSTRSSRFVSVFGGTVYDQTITSTGQSQYAAIIGIIHSSLDFPIRMRGEYVTNGATFDLTDQTYSSAPYVDWQQGYCAHRPAIEGGGSTYVCVYTGGRLAGYTFVQYDWWGANVRYHSDTYSRAWSDNTSSPSYEYQEWTRIGPMVTFGPDLTGRLAVFGGNDIAPAAHADATIDLPPYELNTDFVHPTCTAPPAPVTCRESHIRDVGVFGHTAFGSWPPPTP